MLRLIISALLVANTITLAKAEETSGSAELAVRMVYPNQPPFMTADPQTGQPTGPVVERINEIARLANVKVHWDPLMSRREILSLLSSDTVACSPNLLKTSERAAHYQFTDPAFAPPRWMIVGSTHLDWHQYNSANELFSDPQRTFGRLINATFGEYIDRMTLIADSHTQTFRGTLIDLLSMVDVGRIDYFLIGDEAINHIFDNSQSIDRSRFIFLKFDDLSPLSEGGRIMCSTTVNAKTITALNRGIEKYFSIHSDKYR
ncbi:substrate-binding periplasmic protein [Nitrospirillum amazonense]|uniref:substrate-binding periplasmic protein n=1 Tax=Nitrospirillum amazonense TaxID=28077 RepID=UPI002412BB98|nr:transporter substrate-binding domain-containing protein [Nitrospirillum amazonense]MDG3444564.1 transporter substrate-binding domain-containing protein [Nitrospirillum amazonense]